MPNRTVCSVLSEMRDCIKTSNFSYLAGLIEETQTLVNRMEAALWDQRENKDIRDDIRDLRKERDELTKQVGDLKIVKKKVSN